MTIPKMHAPVQMSFEILFSESSLSAATAERHRLSTESPNTIPASSESVTGIRADVILSETFLESILTESAGSPRRLSAYESVILGSTEEMRTLEPLSASSRRLSATPERGEYFTE